MKRKVVNTKKARLPESDRILLLTGWCDERKID
jgi:hypothetical protein